MNEFPYHRVNFHIFFIIKNILQKPVTFSYYKHKKQM